MAEAKSGDHLVPERILRLYVEQGPLGLIQFDMDSRVTEWSQRAETIFGWSASEVRGRSIDEIGIVAPADRARVAVIVRDLSERRVPWNASENRNLRKDGSLLHCRWFNAFIDADGFQGFVSLVEDVSAAVAARDAVAESEERVRSLFRATPDAVTFFATDGTITDTNPSGERLVRLPRESIIGRHFSEFVAAESRTQAEFLFASVLAGKTVTASLHARRSDGASVPTNVVAGPLRTRGTVTGGYASTRDVTEQAEGQSRLEAGEERYRSLFDHNPDAMIAFDTNGTLVRANAAAGRVLNLEPAAAVGNTLGDIVPDDDLPTALASFNRALAGIAGTVDFSIRRAGGGKPMPASVTLIPIVLRGHAVGVHLHVRDLRPAIAQQRQIAAHAERIRDLYLTAAATENAERQVAATIEAGCRILGLSSGALFDVAGDRIVDSTGDRFPFRLARLALGTDLALAIEDLQGVPYIGDGEDGDEPFRAFIGTGVDVGEVRYGTLVFADRERRPFDDVDRDLVQLMGALVGSAIERSRSRARLRDLAYSDSVTALPNRAWLLERLREELDKATLSGPPLGVLFLDLDRFKDINDTLGHDTGDQLLRIVGERLGHAIRAQDVVARMGGDEFVVLAIDAPDAAALRALAERIITAIEEPVHIDGLEHYVTTSIGVASFPNDGADAETLVKHADVAMYRAKERGRNTYQFFTPALNATLQTRLSQEKTLRKALEQREFVVYYQPQYDLQSGAIVAVEALVRWLHPQRGLVLPGVFIPGAELSGLIVGLGDFVLETACTDIAELRRTVAPNLRLAVNLSARQFHQQQLASKVRAVAERAGFPPTALELEITESVAMSDAALTANIMRDIGAKGVLLSVDDFGTGYSSLGYLRRFPLDSIKIDQSFVADLTREPDAATIVRTVIAMAHALNLEVVAEGVETAEQLEFLRAETCDRVQGFFFSQAISRDALERLILERRAQPVSG